jgi:hypothetical protein
VGESGVRPLFFTRIEYHPALRDSFMDRFFRKDRDPFFRSKSITDFSGLVFNRDRDRDFSFKIADRFENVAL